MWHLGQNCCCVVRSLDIVVGRRLKQILGLSMLIQLVHSRHEHSRSSYWLVVRLRAAAAAAVQKWSQSCFLIALFPLSPFFLYRFWLFGLVALAHIVRWMAVHLSGFCLDRTIRARSLLHCCSRALQACHQKDPSCPLARLPASCIRAQLCIALSLSLSFYIYI